MNTIAKSQERIIEDQARFNQTIAKNQQQNDANKDILNTIVKNQKRIIEDQQKHWIILKQIIALLKRHDGRHAQTACEQEMTVTLLTELLGLFK